MADRGTELRRAQNVQVAMLPPAPKIDALEIACSYHACDMLGGDFYDFISVDSWHLGIVVADVSGHGAAAALLMAAAKKTFQIFGREVLSPRSAVLAVNENIRKDIPRGMFLSAFYGIIDIRSHQLTFVLAGHNPPLLMREGLVTGDWAKVNAPVLGVLPSAQLEKHLKEFQVQLKPGDAMLMYTDGITEAFNVKEEMYGEDRLYGLLSGVGKAAAESVVDAIRHDVATFRGEKERADDETIVVLRVGQRPRDPKPLSSGQPRAEVILPEFDIPMYGRNTELHSLTGLLKAGAEPIIAVTGPTGVGKSHLAIEAARQTQTAFPGGVVYIDVADAKGVGDICRIAGAALELGSDDAKLGLRIANALQSRSSSVGPMLLVMDNSERCRDAVSVCINEWRTRAPDTRILITGNTAPDDVDAYTMVLKPLPMLEYGQRKMSGPLLRRIENSPAVKLFMHVAKRRRPDFELTNDNAEDIAAVCERLDCLPKAIELAASRVDVLSPRQIYQRLDGQFKALGEQGSSLDAALEWTWSLLKPAEQKALMQLSVIPDGFFLEVAEEAIQGTEGLEQIIQSLIRHHMVMAQDVPEAGDDKRFRLFESVRLFARRKLEAAGIAAATEKRWHHALVKHVRLLMKKELGTHTMKARRRAELEWKGLLEVAESDDDIRLRAFALVLNQRFGARQTDANRVDALLKQIRSALSPDEEAWHWLTLIAAEVALTRRASDALKLIEQVKLTGDGEFHLKQLKGVTYFMNGRIPEALELMKSLLNYPGLGPVRLALVQDRLASITLFAGHGEQAARLYDLALKGAREHGDTELEATVLFNRGRMMSDMGKLEEGEQMLRESMRTAQMIGSTQNEINSLGSLTMTLAKRGKAQQAEACIMRALRMCRDLGMPSRECALLNTYCAMLYEQGRTREALDASLRARDLSRECGNRRSEIVADGNVAALRIELGELDGAVESFENCYKLALEYGDKQTAATNLANLGEAHAAIWKARRLKPALRQAIQTLKEALAEVANLNLRRLPGSHLTLAQCLLDANDRDGARNELKKAIEASSGMESKLAIKTASDAKELLSQLNSGPRIPVRTKRGPAKAGPGPKQAPKQAPKQLPKRGGQSNAKSGSSGTFPLPRPRRRPK